MNILQALFQQYLKDEACAVIDGNIERILLRVFDLNRSEKNFKKKIKILAQKLTPLKNNKDYFQSLMDLANIICKKSFTSMYFMSNQ